MLSSVELCAGAGGASLGLEQAGFRPVLLIDNDLHTCMNLRQNRPAWNTVQADLRQFDVSGWHGVDLLSGGLPCPPYSLAVKQHGSDDERDLFPTMLRIVASVQPRAVLVENVRGLLTAKFAAIRESINVALENLGYTPYWTLLNAAEFGVPQKRSRTFLIALKKGQTGPLEWPSPSTSRSVTVGNAIGDLTARMIARIQGFPDDWVFAGGKTHQCRQIGNALPPPLAAAVAKAVAKCLA